MNSLNLNSNARLDSGSQPTHSFVDKDSVLNHLLNDNYGKAITPSPAHHSDSVSHLEYLPSS